MPDQDIRDIYSVLNELREGVAGIVVTVNKLDHSVNGNGRPGLEQRVTVQEQLLISLSACVARHERQHDKQGSKKLATAALVFSGLSSAAALLAVTLTLIG